jgi:hypothetical protein
MPRRRLLSTVLNLKRIHFPANRFSLKTALTIGIDRLFSPKAIISVVHRAMKQLKAIQN